MLIFHNIIDIIFFFFGLSPKNFHAFFKKIKIVSNEYVYIVLKEEGLICKHASTVSRLHASEEKK